MPQVTPVQKTADRQLLLLLLLSSGPSDVVMKARVLQRTSKTKTTKTDLVNFREQGLGERGIEKINEEHYKKRILTLKADFSVSS